VVKYIYPKENIGTFTKVILSQVVY